MLILVSPISLVLVSNALLTFTDSCSAPSRAHVAIEQLLSLVVIKIVQLNVAGAFSSWPSSRSRCPRLIMVSFGFLVLSRHTDAGRDFLTHSAQERHQLDGRACPTRLRFLSKAEIRAHYPRWVESLVLSRSLIYAGISLFT